MKQFKISKSITNRDSLALNIYMRETGREDLLTPEQEVELAQRIKLGDEAALDKLVRANLRFVISVAKQYENNFIPLADLINEGNLGLIKAARRFDETRGFKFLSFGVWWIRQSIMLALAENSRLVRLPTNKLSVISKINKAHSKLEQELQDEPSPEAIATLLDTSLEEVEVALGVAGTSVSFDAPLTSDADSSTRLELFSDKNAKSADNNLDHQESLKIEMERILSTFTERQREVVKLFFGIGIEHPVSLDDIGKQLGISMERARQIKEDVLKKLQTSRGAPLRQFLAN